MKYAPAKVLALLVSLLVPLAVVATSPSSSAQTTSTTKLRMFSANVGHQVKLPQVRADMRQIKPDVVVLSEAYRACKAISSIAHDQGYNVVQRPCNMGSDTAVLVRKNFTIVKHWFLQMNQRWTGPHGGAQPPKGYPVLWVRNPQGRMWVVVGVHFPWVHFKGDCGFLAGQNLRAWNESWRKVSRLIGRQKTRTVAAGDWNAKPCQLRRPAKNAGALLVPVTKVDHAIVRHVTRTTHHTYTPPNKIDHGWIGFTFTSPVS